jgi:hypothetical protein
VAHGDVVRICFSMEGLGTALYRHNARPTGSACVPCCMTDETCVTASFVVQFRFAEERIGIDLSYGIR